jgi:hypothetical protein
VKGWTNLHRDWWKGPIRRGFPLLVWETVSGNWFWGDDQTGAAGPFETKEAAMEAAERVALVRT